MSILYLSVTAACNLACDYCFVSNGLDAFDRDAVPPHEQRDRLVRFVEDWTQDTRLRERLARDVTVYLYGGEPFLRPDRLDIVLSGLVDALRAAGRRVRVEAVTNGTTLTDATMRLIKKHRIGIAISLDGLDAGANEHRRFRGGDGAFASTLKGIAELRKAGLDFGISCTISPENRSGLRELIAWASREFGVKSFGLNLLLRGGPSPPPSQPEEDNRALQDAFLFARTLGVYEDRIGRKAKAFNSHGQVYWKDCAARGHQLVFFADGSVGTCQAYLRGGQRFGRLGSVTPREVLSSDLFARWARLSPVIRAECTNCPAVGLCGGGCAFDAERTHRDLCVTPEDYCIHARSTVEFLVRLAAADSLGGHRSDVSGLVADASVTDVTARFLARRR